MTLRLNGSTSGYVEIDAPATAGSTSITLPAVSGGQFVVTDSNGNLGLGTTSPVEELHINSATPSIRLSDTAGSNLITRITNSQGDLYFDADFGGTTGDIIFRSNGTLGRWVAGGGLAFGADTAAVNQLDDYEEGAWTPAFVNAGTATYNAQVGRYTKIGNLVYATAYLDINTVGTASGKLRISGLPFTTANNSAYFGSSSVHGTGWTTARRGLNILWSANVTSSDEIYYNMAGTTQSANPSITGSDWGTADHSDLGTGNLLFSLVYQAS